MYIDIPSIRGELTLRCSRKGYCELLSFFKFSIQEEEKLNRFFRIDVTDQLRIRDNEIEAFRSADIKRETNLSLA